MKLPYPCPKCEAPIMNYSGVCMACGHGMRRVRAVPRITEAQARDMLNAAIKEAGTQRKWAEQHGVTNQYVCDVVNGRRGIGESISVALGLRRIVLFEAAED